jgi:hypothetical protein
MIAGDWGHTTLVFQATYNKPFDDCIFTYGDFTGVVVCTLVCIGPDFQRRQFICNIAANKASASYTPQAATDFPLNGIYESELELTYDVGGPQHTKPFKIVVGPDPLQLQASLT